jgi:hypothetical protein
MACLNMTKNFQIDAEACRTIETAMCANPYETEKSGAGQHDPEAQALDWNGDLRGASQRLAPRGVARPARSPGAVVVSPQRNGGLRPRTLGAL